MASSSEELTEGQRLDAGIMEIDPNNDEQVSAKFQEFKKHFDRNYADSAEEEKRLKIFKDNLIKIQKLNSNPEDTATYGLNDFADKSPEEMRMRCGLRRPNQ
ncbi:unnamed protein product [Bemisia tabaci]|uniref:Cathepsin propeptide inhibitor domain-containing protein n=1 Tax=Bemisia tabaci TaxID=7038 RepID=A0A9P0A759_BEMTA|nr:PREDICTED: putative cysteine proteinase CG12163 [Bemisia tabaci]CAH0385614.1 unnamed protein product [Bemisia tabaci]